MEEVYSFSQRDLVDTDVMILDAYHEVFIWYGKNSSIAERNMSNTVAKEYVATATDGRPETIPITPVDAKKEPISFKCHFHGWVEDLEVQDESL